MLQERNDVRAIAWPPPGVWLAKTNNNNAIPTVNLAMVQKASLDLYLSLECSKNWLETPYRAYVSKIPTNFGDLVDISWDLVNGDLSSVDDHLDDLCILFRPLQVNRGCIIQSNIFIIHFMINGLSRISGLLQLFNNSHRSYDSDNLPPTTNNQTSCFDGLFWHIWAGQAYPFQRVW